MKRRLLTVAGVTAIAALAAGPAWALWTSNASGSASAKAANMPTGGTLTSPAAGNTSTSNAAISVAWPVANYVGPSPAVAVPSYIVKRYVGAAPTQVADATPLSAGCGGSSGIISATSCTDTVTANGIYSYTVTPLKQVTPATGNWVGTEGPKSGTVTYTAAAATPAAFVVTAASPQVAGTAFNITIQAKNSAGNDASYTGVKSLTFSGPASSPSGTAPTYGAATFDSTGLATVSVTLTKAQTIAIAVSDPSAVARNASSGNIVVNAGNSTLFFGTSCSSWDKKKNAGSNGTTTTTLTRGTDALGNPVTDVAAFTATMGATGGSWSTGAFTFAANAQTSSNNLTWTNSTSSGTSVTASASGGSRTAASCGYTTTN